MRRMASIRVRTTVGASAVALVALTIAAVLLVATLRRSQLSAIDQGLELRSVDIESLLDGGAAPASVAVESEDSSFVQILDLRGRVVASSSNINGEPSVLPSIRAGWSTRTIPALGKDAFRVHARSTDGRQRVTIAVGTSLKVLQRTQQTLVASLVVGVPGLLVFLAGLTWVVVGRSLRPVDTIRRRVDEIGAGQLDQRVPVPAPRDEVGRLATTMNRMLDRLEDSHRRQARFVSDASHELRTPISIIRHELEIALAAPDDRRWRETAREVLDEDVRMQRLVDDLLFIARCEHAPPSPVATTELVDLDDLVVAEARRQRGEVRIDLSGVSAGQVRGNAEHLSRVISNLFDNAARHAVSRIAARVGAVEGRVVVEIDDDGPGIPESQRERVFERFARIDEARARDDGGAGLGLAIARDIVTTHGGTIAADTSPELGGARITVDLPDARA